MKKAVSYIRHNLATLYQERDINSFIYWIFEEMLNIPSYRLPLMDVVLDDMQMDIVKGATNRLSMYEPIQYIVGRSIFDSRVFEVSRDVLIPRPETAGLVHIIADDFSNSSPSILDIGTGSGSIAVSLASLLPFASVTGADISAAALSIAKRNAVSNNVKVNWINIDILSDDSLSLLDCYDCIVSNPPYVMEKEKIHMERNVLDYEPSVALFVPDDDPLLFYKRIAYIGKQKLNQGGILYFEINEQCGSLVKSMLEKSGYREIELMIDNYGKDRYIKARL